MYKKKTLNLLITAALLGVAANATAERAGMWDISPMIGQHDFSGDQDLERGNSLGLWIGHHIDEQWAVEMAYSTLNSESSNTNMDVDGSMLRLDALYHINQNDALTPYLAAGLGRIKLEPDGGSSNTESLINVGGGIKYAFNEALSARADLRFIRADDENNTALMVGINYLFGAKTAPIMMDSDGDGVLDGQDECPSTTTMTPVNSQGCPLDSDHDGVPDQQDNCPATMANTMVDAKGCTISHDRDGDGVLDEQDNCPNTSAGVKVDKQGCTIPMDSDGDGVLDQHDRCNNTPTGAKVDNNGCRLDTDKDGVVDDVDQCPETSMGTMIDSSGCPVDMDGDGVNNEFDQCPNTRSDLTVDEVGCPVLKSETVTINIEVNFDSGKTVIKPEYHDTISEVADFLTTYPRSKITIEGYTDNRGSEAANLTLSQKRATSVRNYLIDQFGIDGDRISAIGYGPANPIADNNTAAGRNKNRRVVGSISAQKR